jgi:hypothetical protein
VPNQSSQGSQAAVGNGAQGNSTSAIPQASVGGVSGVPPIVAQHQARFLYLHKHQQIRDFTRP